MPCDARAATRTQQLVAGVLIEADRTRLQPHCDHVRINEFSEAIIVTVARI